MSSQPSLKNVEALSLLGVLQKKKKKKSVICAHTLLETLCNYVNMP